MVRFHEALHERALALPGVVAAGNAWTFPLNSSFSGADGAFQLEGSDPGVAALPRASQIGASGEYSASRCCAAGSSRPTIAAAGRESCW